MSFSGNEMAERWVYPCLHSSPGSYILPWCHNSTFTKPPAQTLFSGWSGRGSQTTWGTCIGNCVTFILYKNLNGTIVWFYSKLHILPIDAFTAFYHFSIGFPGIFYMERFLQAHLLGGACRISFSESPYRLPSQPASSAQAPPVLCQLLSGLSSKRAAPHSVCGGVPHPGYDTKHVENIQNKDIG